MRALLSNPWIGLVALLVVVAIAYAPGLAGDFHLDDANNLAMLGAFGGVHDATTFAYYLTSGFADPTGRPVSMLSYLIDARDWPAPARGFKVTNLGIHLANGVLLFVLIARLEKRLGGDRHGGWTALLAAGLWLAHPMWVSTTLYVVQRHAMLPVLFGLLALIAWDASWASARAADRRGSWLWGLLGTAGCISLAALSKPNGILIAPVGLVVAAIAYPRLESPAARSTSRQVLWIALGAPTLVCTIWLIAQFANGLDYQGSRPWTLAQRLLTEPRVLFDYLHQLLLPSPGDPARFSDTVEVSTGIFHPWSTALAIAGLAAALTVAVTTRKRMPRSAIAIAGFLVAHTMESGPVMLELAFEHRNYLPSLFLFWPLAHACCSMRGSQSLKVSVAITAISLLSWMTFVGAQRWGDPKWVSPHLEDYAMRSPRSAALHVERSLLAGGADAGRLAAQRMGQLHAGDLALAMLRVEVECLTGEVSLDAAANARRLLRQRVVSDLGLLQAWFSAMAEFAHTRRCAGLTADVFRGWVEAVLNNPRATVEPRYAQATLRVFGSWQLRGDDPAGIETLWRAVALAPRPDMVLLAAAALAEAGAYGPALDVLDRYPPRTSPRIPWTKGMPALHDEILHATGHWEREFRHLRGRILEDTPEPDPAIDGEPIHRPCQLPAKMDPATGVCLYPP